MKNGGKNKSVVFIILFSVQNAGVRFSVMFHLIHLHFYSLEMLYILLLNRERDLSFTLYLLQVLNFYCPCLFSADFSSDMNE